MVGNHSTYRDVIGAEKMIVLVGTAERSRDA
jgi:hypothetical protein